MKKLTLLLSLSALLLLSACIGINTPPPDEPEWTQSTVRGTLELFGDAWNNADLPAYQKLLDVESFVFYFSEGDAGNGYPVFWELDTELTAADNLYEDAQAEQISLQLSLNDVEEPAEGVTSVRVNHVPYDLYVTLTGYYDNDEDLTFHSQSSCDFTLELTDGKWFVVTWRDYSSTGGCGIPCGIEEITWGATKAFFEEQQE